MFQFVIELFLNDILQIILFILSVHVKIRNKCLKLKNFPTLVHFETEIE